MTMRWPVLSVLGSIAAMAGQARLDFSTFLAANAWGSRVATNRSGDIWVAATVNAGGSVVVRADSPIPPCPQPPCPGEIETQGDDVFVMRMSPDAAERRFLVTIGGSGSDSLRALAADDAGNAYVLVSSFSADIPTTRGVLGPAYVPTVSPQNLLQQFLAKLGPDGTIEWATYLPREAGSAAAIAVNSAGEVILTGTRFIYRVDRKATAILSRTTEAGGSFIALDASQNIYVAGTAVRDYPVTSDAIQSSVTDAICANNFLLGSIPCSHQYLTKLAPDAVTVRFSTWISGAGGEFISGMAEDAGGNVYLAGQTSAPDYPHTRGKPEFREATAQPLVPLPQPTFYSYLTKVSTVTRQIVFSTPLPGSTYGYGLGPVVAIDSQGRIYAAIAPTPGSTGSVSSDYGVFFGQVPEACRTGSQFSRGEAIVARIASDGSAILGSRVLAGRGIQSADSIAITPDGKTLVTGATAWPDVAITPGVQFSSAPRERTRGGVFLSALDFRAPDAPQIACVMDNANLLNVTETAPGQLISIFGDRLGPEEPVVTAPDADGVWPRAVEGLEVLFDEVPGALLYASEPQVNVQVPYEVAGRNATIMEVRREGQTIDARVLRVAERSPALFLDLRGAFCDGVYGAVFAVARNQDSEFNACDHPAALGSELTLFVNGIGITATSGESGRNANERRNTDVPIEVTVGGERTERAEVLYFGPDPGSIDSFYRLTLRIPPIQPLLNRIAGVSVAVDKIAAMPSYSPAGPAQPAVVAVTK